MPGIQTPEQQAVSQYNETADPAWKLSEQPQMAPEAPPEPQQASPRTFYRSDYGRAARLIQAARHVPGDRYTAKPEAQQDAVSALAVALATAFAADSPDRFDTGKFFAATQLPVKPQASDPDGNYFEVAPDDWNGTPEESDPA